MAPSTPGIPAKRVLPAKESTLFKELLTLYETHNLKKAQKVADQILKKIPEHGGQTSANNMQLPSSDESVQRLLQ